MSLFGSIQLAGNALRANDIALQVVGQNIANANTPGYIREEVVMSTAPTQRMGGLLLGLGVEVEAVIQKVDKFLEDRLRGAVSERASAETHEQAFMQLEGLINELGDSDLSTLLNDFFSSISEVLNQPESTSVRNLAVLQGQTLAQSISRLTNRVRDLRADLNERIEGVTDRVNRLTEEIGVLNLRITTSEGGGTSSSDAVGLRDQRLVALENLAELIAIRVAEQPSGAVNVYAGGDYLVFEGSVRQVETVMESDRGLAVANIELTETGAPLDSGAGELYGLQAARDETLGGFIDELDDFAKTFIFEFNQIHSSGQGLTGYTELTGEYRVSDPDAPLDQAGLIYTPKNGLFQVLVRNATTGLTKTTDIRVDLNDLGAETTLRDLADDLDMVEGISASWTVDGRLSIESDSPDEEFSFADDTSGVLASLGVNTFFSGSNALDIGVNDVLRADPAKFAASRDGIAFDSFNAVEMAGFFDRPLESENDTSLSVLYDRLVGEAFQGSTVTQSVAEGARVFEQTLRGQKMATSGVNLDEEAIKLMAYQRAFQAMARYVSVLDDLFGVLVDL